ncbi:MAG: hypothetical protein EXR48_03045 [Dehalococcoidia bacterium]|nr:hypothetical protein [Dehalococcoidia bacterium]
MLIVLLGCSGLLAVRRLLVAAYARIGRRAGGNRESPAANWALRVPSGVRGPAVVLVSAVGRMVFLLGVPGVFVTAVAMGAFGAVLDHVVPSRQGR